MSERKAPEGWNALPNWMSLSQDWVHQVADLNPFSKLFPFNYAEMGQALITLGTEMIKDPAGTYVAWMDLMLQQFEVMLQTSRQAWGLDHTPVVEPDRKDRRFAAEEWSKNAVFNAIKQSYLLNYRWFLAQLERSESLSPAARRKANFYLRQYLDSVSPSNSPFLNPVVIEETIKTGGENLIQGLRQLTEDLQQGKVTMVESSGFEFGKNIAASPGQVVLRTPILELIQYAPRTEKVRATPLLFVPPWINKYYILDLQPKNSMVSYLTNQGYTVFMISWKNPDESYADFGMEDYITQGLLPAIDAAIDISKAPAVNPIGYCIGGTLLSIALAALRAKGDKRLNAVTFFVSLQDFEEPGDLGVFVDEEQLKELDKRMARRGYLEADEMAAAMNLLRSNDLIWNYVVNNYLLGKRPMAFDLLFWNSDGTRMPRKAHLYYLRNMYIENNLVKPGKLEFLGEKIDLGKIDNDIYAVGTIDDHIVPWRSAFKIRRYASGPVRFVLANSGHIAGVISPPGGKGTYFSNDESTTTDPDEWLEGAVKRPGSWWEDWIAWLAPRSGDMVAPPSMGNRTYKPIEPAPGHYVREMGGEIKYPPTDVAVEAMATASGETAA
ncbi:MAG TPA: class I poly(R)-hydroxyalkanoic acid synthase [Chloroflexota bacterium]|nr:class I poly(R)-hydroxyalkanoic acid synthase [Chloroflexota bacterium]